MIHLSDKKCIACEGGVPPLTEGEIKTYLTQIKEGWEVIDTSTSLSAGNKKIQKEFIFENFKQAMEFVNKVAPIAEEEGHHPDIYIFYNKVKLELWTHAIGGLSENDFILAAKVDNI
ncbi:MAG: 4a-hydroxytetrahydrobiopterin dehydratase [Candidatus Liptonbacteria bacterium]|nr:4a-hydroxytetrahydrobiopterin dehydratase [Candidatus Liptonbacteria bacterium]